MGLDRYLKRFYPLILLGMIGCAAYFQASGIGQMLGAAVAEPPMAVRAQSGSAALETRDMSGHPILARNPFDSITGPLVGSTPTGPLPPVAGTSVISSDDPYSDPKCSAGRVILISESDDPEWSFASIEDSGGESKLRRAGDDVSGHKVTFVGWDRVWMTEGTTRCQLKLGDKTNVKAPTKRKRKTTRKKTTRGSRKMPPEMMAKINKVSDTEFNIERSLVSEVLENQAELMRSARIVPDKGNGDEVLGIKLFGIRSGTLLSELGFKNGDRLETINGFPMSDPQKALEAYGRLQTADGLKVKVNRGGKPVQLDFNIQ